jgi:recombinational DNA repair protein (RecF pathway)
MITLTRGYGLISMIVRGKSKSKKEKEGMAGGPMT